MKNYSAKTVDEYIANSPEEAQSILREIRAAIQSTIPNVEETLSWGVPFYRYHGALGGYAVHKNHVSFGSGGSDLQSEDREKLEQKGYKTGKTTIQIKFGQEVTTAAIKQILKEQAKMNELQER